MPTHDGAEHIQIDLDPLLADVDLDHDMTLQLPAWQWIALGKLSEYYEQPMSTVVQRWISERLQLLTVHGYTNPGPTYTNRG